MWLHEYLDSYPDKIDELKYVLTAIAPESKDAEFTWKDYQSRVNSELADVFGNFVNRTIVLTNKYYSGAVPTQGEPSAQDLSILEEISRTGKKIEELIMKYKLREAQAEMMCLLPELGISIWLIMSHGSSSKRILKGYKSSCR